MTQMTEAKSQEAVKHITKQLLSKTEKIKSSFTSSSRTKKKHQFLHIYDFTQFQNSTCSTALENFSGLEAKSSRSYSHKKIRWVIQGIF